MIRTIDIIRYIKKFPRLVHSINLKNCDPSDLDTSDLDQWINNLKEMSLTQLVPGLAAWERISVNVDWHYESVSISFYGHYTESDEEYFDRIDRTKFALKAKRKKDREDRKARQLKQEAEERLLFERLREKYGP